VIDLKTYQFSKDTGTVSSAVGIKYDQVLGIFREGTYVPFTTVSLTPTDKEGTLYSFQRRSLKQMPGFSTGVYFTKIASIPLGSDTTHILEVGSGVQPNNYRYFFTGALGTAEYNTLGGETPTAIVSALAFTLGLLGYTVTTGANTVAVRMPTSDPPSFGITFQNPVKYQRGYYVDLEGAQYLISVVQSFSNYPSYPTEPTSVAFEDLTPVGLYGVDFYLYEQDTVHLSDTYSEIEIGPVDITGADSTDYDPVEPGCVGWDDENDRIVFGSEFLGEEQLIVLYKVQV